MSKWGPIMVSSMLKVLPWMKCELVERRATTVLDDVGCVLLPSAILSQSPSALGSVCIAT